MKRAHFALLAGLCLPVFFWGLGRYGLVNQDEAIYQGIAERMAASGDWLRLDFRGEPRFYDSFLNAPLHYWLRAALISLFGSNAWTLRILSAAAGAGTVLATAGLAARIAGSRAGVAAGLVLLTTFQFVFLHGARTGELDALVSLQCVGLAWLFLGGVEDSRSFVPHHLVLCALLWTKAPLVLVALAVEGLHFALSRTARLRLRAWLASGLLVAPLAASWHLLQLSIWWERAPAVLSTFWDQASGARTDGDYGGRLANGVFYLRTLAWGAFPWSVLLPFALLSGLREPRLRLLLLWPTLLLAFFTLVAKHYAWYVLPLYPFFAIALAVWLADAVRAPAGLGALAAAAMVAALLCVDPISANPFAEVALTYPMRWRTPPSPPELVIALFAAALAAGAMLALERRAPRARQLAVLALAGVLLFGAARRTAAPLFQLDHEPPMDRLREALARAQRESRPLPYPVRVPEGSVQIARYLFAEDYEIEVRQDGGGRTTLWLHPRGDPAVVERSIGRLGLERRLARGQPAP